MMLVAPTNRVLVEVTNWQSSHKEHYSTITALEFILKSKRTSIGQLWHFFH